jgi:hypothetical protein
MRVENIVFDAQEVLAAAYIRQGRYDDALFLQRYVAETVQSMLRDRRRNKEALIASAPQERFPL